MLDGVLRASVFEIQACEPLRVVTRGEHFVRAYVPVDLRQINVLVKRGTPRGGARRQVIDSCGLVGGTHGAERRTVQENKIRDGVALATKTEKKKKLALAKGPPRSPP